jgi:hypothetical protein
MLQLTKITYGFLYLMLLSPILSYLTYDFTGISITYYFQLFTVFYGLLFVIIKDKRIHFGAMYYLLISYIVYIIIWSVFNGYMESKGPFNIVNLHLFSILMILIIIDNSRFNEKFIKNCIIIIKITVLITAIVSLIQVINPAFMQQPNYHGLQENISIYTFRRVSIFGFMDRNELGLTFMPLLSVLAGFILYNRKKSLPFFLILGGIVAFLSNGRYIMVAFIIITFQILVFQKVKVKGMIKFATLSIIILFLLYQLLVYLGYNISEWYNSRLLAEGSLKETTRYKAWETFLIFFPQNVLFGTGVTMTPEILETSLEAGSSGIHVGYLAHLVSYGIVGSFFQFGFWFLLARKLYRTAKRTNYWGSFFAFFIYLWSQATFPNYSIYFYGLIFAFIFDKHFKDAYNESTLFKHGEKLNTGMTYSLS